MSALSEIGMRMLTPRELLTTQGFSLDQVIEGGWENLISEDPHWRTFAKDMQVSRSGNSVCPPLATAIVGANCQHLAIEENKRTG